MDVGQHTAGGDGHGAQQNVQLLVVADGQHQVAGHDAGALVVAGGVAGQLQDLGAQVLQHGGQVHRGATAEAGSQFLLAHVAGDAAHGELEASARGAGGGLGASAAAALALALALGIFLLSGIGVGGHCDALWQKFS